MRILFFILLPFLSFSQVNTEIYVFDLAKSDGSYQLSNPVNISSQNPGYDNQPYFLSDNELLYSSERKGQTDVILVELNENSWSWKTTTQQGSEYSPTPMFKSENFSAIRLDTTGFQRLYEYDAATGESKVLLDDLVVGYHTWIDQERLLVFVLGEPHTLQLCNIETDQCEIIDSDPGRSLHKIPGTSDFSYISLKGTDWEIRSFDPQSRVTEKITGTLKNSQDLAWTPDGMILMAQENKLFQYAPGADKNWQLIADLSEYKLSGITRLAVNPSGSKIALVVNE